MFTAAYRKRNVAIKALETSMPIYGRCGGHRPVIRLITVDLVMRGERKGGNTIRAPIAMLTIPGRQIMT
jgi:hypothetical protein